MRKTKRASVFTQEPTFKGSGIPGHIRARAAKEIAELTYERNLARNDNATDWSSSIRHQLSSGTIVVIVTAEIANKANPIRREFKISPEDIYNHCESKQ